MRVCVLAYTFYESDTRVRRYAETLAKQGDSVDIVALRRGNEPKKENFRGVTIHRIQQRLVNERGKFTYLFRLLFFFLRSMAFVTREHLRCPYELIHVHSIPDFEIFAAWFPKLTGAKLILDVHDLVPEFYASKFRTSLRSLPCRSLLAIERVSAAFADHVIVANDIWEERLVTRSVNGHKCTTILNYPDMSIFKRRGRVRSDRKFIMLYPGTLSYHQGLDIAVRAFSLIKDDVPDAEFHIYGIGDQKEHLEQLITELSLEGRALIEGIVPAEEVAAIMENADLGVVPKRSEAFGNEAFSTKILEFMCLGVPVLVADTRIDRYYFDETMVQFFRAGDEIDLARRMLQLIKDKGLREQLVKGSNRFIRENNWDTKKNIYLNLVRTLNESDGSSTGEPTKSGAAALVSKGKVRSRSKNKTNRIDALVTQAWGRIAYNVVRSLGKHGLKVAVGSDEFQGMTHFSRYARIKFQHPSFVSQPREFAQSIRAAIERYEPKVYLPSDQENLVIARYRSEFDGLSAEIPIAPFETLRTLHKKNELVRLAQSLGIPTPETIVPRGVTDILDFSNEFGCPTVLKRLSSSGSRGVSYLDKNSLPLLSNGHSPLRGMAFGEFMVQRYVKGTGYGVSMLFNRGELRAKFTHKRLREKTRTGGISTLRTGVVNPTLEEYAERLLKSVQFHGVAMVEFKFDEQTRRGWLIEVNPRFWGSLALAIQSGVDFPYLLYRIAEEGDVPPVLEYIQGLNVRWILGDLRALADQFKFTRTFSPGSGGNGRAHGFDDLYWDDPLPFVGEAALSVWKYIKLRKLSAAQRDISIDELEKSPSFPEAPELQASARAEAP